MADINTTIVAQLNDELRRAHGREMHLTPTVLLLAAKDAMERMMHRLAVIETEQALLAAPPAALAVPACTCPSGDGSLRWPCPQHPPAAQAVPADNVTPMRQPRADLARLVESINAAVYANGDGLSVTEAIGALELAKLELLKEQEQ